MDRQTYVHVRFHDVIEEVKKRFYIHDGKYERDEFDADWFDYAGGTGVNLSSDSIYFEIDKNAKGLHGLISYVLVEEGFSQNQSLYLDIFNWF